MDKILLRFLRFLNLLEPGRNILSISKIMMWVFIWAAAYVVIYSPENTVAVIGAVSANFVATVSYGYRRHAQHQAQVQTDLMTTINSTTRVHTNDSGP